MAGKHVLSAQGARLFLGRDHRLTAFARAEEGLLRWTQSAPGASVWDGPELIASPRFLHFGMAQGADGFLHFFGVRAAGATDLPVVVHAVQYQTGRPLTRWHAVGTPYKDAEQARSVLPPAAALGPSGRLHLFLARSGGGVSVRHEAADGGWPAWRGLRGQLSQEGMVAATSASGLVELLVPAGNGRAMRWRQDTPDGEMTRCPNIHIAPAPGTLAVLETAPDRMTYYWSDTATGAVLAHRPGEWIIPLGGAGESDGRISVLRTALDGYDCTVLAHRAPTGDVMLAACATENEAAGLWWAPTGERSAGPPALAADAYGRVVVATLDESGRLRIARQAEEPGLVMGPAIHV
ncbi:hypothetical protein [uncultured Streptomyces sp.]|uniref:hypothetical protein n=1 Tax=uncultured Streptomyces sp. TaxID=174707 RepID=UPI002603C277|nr:hypothetical protein [uncultured Streptomyces sp.]